MTTAADIHLKSGLQPSILRTIQTFLDQVFSDPQVEHLGMTQNVQHPTLGRIQLVGQPFTLSRQQHVDNHQPGLSP